MLATLTLTLAAAVAANRPNRPNVLFLMADEMDGRILDPTSPQTHPPLPHLNRLADRGAVFTTTYAQSMQCVPSRSAMMVGLRTDQIEVYDNAMGITSVNGDPSKSDHHCVAAFGAQACVDFAKAQKAPPTFIDLLDGNGYNVTLYGKMHVGAGLDRFPGMIGEFPFDIGKDNKIRREWSRGLGPATNVKGVPQHALQAFTVPDNVPIPAPAADYAAIKGCVEALRAGGWGVGSAGQFLYCSIIVPHPAYKSNATYMEAVENLTMMVPSQVPKAQLHPNDVSASTLRGLFDTDDVDPKVVKHFRQVYFSMCYESDMLLGEVLDALDDSGSAANTYVMMVSDHGENCVEHRQLGKNNMYDSASRVACILAGPGIKAGQSLPTLASLNDVFPTVLGFAGIPEPDGLAGRSLLKLANGAGDPGRNDFVTGQYHSVFSVTGSFMIRQGDYKLVLYAENQFGEVYPAQLFHLPSDPWELRDVSRISPSVVARLSALLGTVLNTSAVDARVKEVQKALFTTYAYEPAVANSTVGCAELMLGLYGPGFNATDAAHTAEWLGKPCPFQGPPPPDPTCSTGIEDKEGRPPYACCAASCGVCAHPSAACQARPGGAASCCPAIVEKGNVSCSVRGPPCVMP